MTNDRLEVTLTEAERTSVRIRLTRMNERGMAPWGPLAELRRLSARDVAAVAAGDGVHADLAAAELHARHVAGLARVAERDYAPPLDGFARTLEDLAAAFAGVAGGERSS